MIIENNAIRKEWKKPELIKLDVGISTTNGSNPTGIDGCLGDSCVGPVGS